MHQNLVKSQTLAVWLHHAIFVAEGEVAS